MYVYMILWGFKAHLKNLVVTPLLTETCCSLPISSPAALMQCLEILSEVFLTSFKNSIPFIWFMHLHFLGVLIYEFYSTFVLWYIPGAIEENACAVFTKM